MRPLDRASFLIDRWIDIAEVGIVHINIIAFGFSDVKTAEKPRPRVRKNRSQGYGEVAIKSAIFCGVGFCGGIWSIVLRLGQPGKVLYKYLCGLTLALFHTLDQADALCGVQFSQKFNGLVIATVECLPDFADGEINVNTAQLVMPAVPGGQAHTLQHEGV